MGKIKSFLIAVFGIEEESKWLHSEQVNIFITAIIPGILSLIGVVITYFNSRPKQLSFSAILGNEVFINTMQLVVIICTLLVTYRIRRSILVTSDKTPRLLTYIEKECNLRDQSREKVEGALTVVKKTVCQFYFFWIALWTSFLIYYSGNLCFSILETVPFNSTELDNHCLEITVNGFNNIFNCVSSSLLFALFLVLNSVTVSLSERRTGRYGMISAVSIIFLFVCIIIFPTLFSSALSGQSYLKLQFFTSFFLGIYSAMTFVLFLGKLNTNLQIPRFIFYWLYIYALVQIFQFIYIPGIKLENDCSSCNIEFLSTYKFKTIFQYVTLIGKMFLSLTLIWIAYNSRFIHYVLRQSQAITDLKYRMNVFKTYMRDV